MCRNVSASPSVSASPFTHLITHEPLHVCRVLCIYVLLSSFVSVSDFQCFTALLSSLVLFLFFLFPNGRAINQRGRERRGEEGGEGDTGRVPGEERLACCPEKERKGESEQ